MRHHSFPSFPRFTVLPSVVLAMASLTALACSASAQGNPSADKLESLVTHADAGRGLQEFRGAGCPSCHGEDAEGSDGPPLVGLRLAFSQFIHWVRNASSGMYPFSPDAVSDAQLADIYLFLHGPVKPGAATQPPAKEPAPGPEEPVFVAPPGNPDNGGQLFQQVGCANCHGSKGQGASGPPILDIPQKFPEFEAFVRKQSGAMPPSTVAEDKLVDIYAYLARLFAAAGPPNAASSAAKPASTAAAKSGTKP